jgi:uncharacterized repeat protein (TIGR01451 family)
MNRGKALLGGLAVAGLLAVLYLLMALPARADLLSIIHTTLEDFNAGILYRTGLTRIDDGEVQLLVVGLAGEWITDTNTTGLPALARHAAVRHQDHILVLGGRKTNNQPSSEVYYTTIDYQGHDVADWQTTTPLPSAAYPNGLFWHSAVVVNDRVYVMGGADNATRYATVAFAPIDPVDGTLGGWTITEPLTEPLSLLRASVSGSRIYVIGGWGNDNQARDTVYFAEPDPDTGLIDAWTQTTDFPYATFGHMATTCFGNVLYVMGGTHITETIAPYTNFALPNPTTGHINTWQGTDEMKNNNFAGAGLCYNGVLFTTGGALSGLTQPSDYVGTALIGPNGQIASWRDTSLIVPGRFHHAAVHSSDGWLYVIGGSDGSGPIDNINRGSTSGVGDSYAPEGTFESPTIDLGKTFELKELRWNTFITDTAIMGVDMYYRSKRNLADPWNPGGPFPSLGPGTVTTTQTIDRYARYFEYELHFHTDLTSTTPVLNAVELIYEVPYCGLFVDKDADPVPGSTVYPDDVIAYTLTYTNVTGSITATNAYIIDDLPAHTTYVPGSIWGLGADPSAAPRLRWNLGTVYPGTGGTVGFSVTVDDDIVQQTSIENLATTHSADCAIHPSNSVFHTAKPPTLELDIVKDAEPPPGSTVEPGTLITYTVSYTNVGRLTASSAVLTDTFDPQDDFGVVSETPEADDKNDDRYVWNLGTLQQTDDGQIQIVVQLKDVLPNNWPVTNQASIASPEASPFGSNVVTHTIMNMSGTEPAPMVDFIVENIRWEPEEPVAGSPLDFYATITNQGTADAGSPFWLAAALYIKPSPSEPPAGPSDHDRGYCLNGCSILRANFIDYVPNLAQGESWEVKFEDLEADPLFPAADIYDIYVQIDVAFGSAEYDLNWGLYPEDDEFNNLGHKVLVIPLTPGSPTIYLPLINRNF